LDVSPLAAVPGLWGRDGRKRHCGAQPASGGQRRSGKLSLENRLVPQGKKAHSRPEPNQVSHKRGRFYSPAWHRFLNSDQGADQFSLNQFAYAGGSPMMRTDPSGMMSQRQFLEQDGDYYSFGSTYSADTYADGMYAGVAQGNHPLGEYGPGSTGVEAQAGTNVVSTAITLYGASQMGLSVKEIPDSTTFLYVWPNTGSSGDAGNWGHTAVMLADGTYISWWPQAEGRDGSMSSFSIYSAPAIADRSFEDDMADEGTSPTVYELHGLNQDAMQGAWSDWKSNPNWTTFLRNCADTAAYILNAGGLGLPSYPVWSPSNFINLGNQYGWKTN
jgi:RHS repeat-associated protein